MEKTNLLPEGCASNVEYASALMDRVVVLGAKLVELTNNGLDRHAASAEVFEEVKTLEAELKDMPELIYRFSGEGFVPLNVEGVAQTTYSRVDEGAGRFNGLYLLSGDDNNYYSIEDFYDDTGLDDSAEGDLVELPESYAVMVDRLRTPPHTVRLYADFVSSVHTAEDQLVAGLCIRTNVTTAHKIMDTSKMAISLIQGKDDPTDIDTPLSIDLVIDELFVQSERIAKCLRNTKFRRMSASAQIRHLERLVEQANVVTRVDRFNGFVIPDSMFIPEISEGRRKFMYYQFRDDFSGLEIQPIKLDSPDLYTVQEGIRLVNDSRLVSKWSGLNLIARVSDLSLSEGFEPEFIWLPLDLDLISQLSLFEKDVHSYASVC